MKFLTSLFFFVGLSSRISAQEATAKPTESFRNIISAYIGLFDANLNYERNILQLKKSRFNIRPGVGWMTDFQSEGKYFSTSLVYLRGKESSHLELDAGGKLVFERLHAGQDSFYYRPTLKPDVFMGYRFEKPQGHFMFRAGFSFFSLFELGFGVKF